MNEWKLQILGEKNFKQKIPAVKVEEVTSEKTTTAMKRSATSLLFRFAGY
jgi:beta-amyrin synthase